ncbi:MAG TPA: hypothetical protein VFH73_23385 [Polyangia bacterium]|jgi:hypothetical protein|nr:hypothetical protein [Polyangia bacterium]
MVLLGWSCDGPGNTGKIVPDTALVRAVPWQNGVLPAVEPTGEPVIPFLPVYPSIGFGRPDPGSQHTDCAAAAGYEFSTGWFDDFEPRVPDNPSATGVAPGWSAYDDLSQYAFHTPGDETWYPGLKDTTFVAWGMPADKVPGPSCEGKPNNWVLHFRGGLFRKWGGGMSHAFVDPVGLRYRTDPTEACAPNLDFCPPPVAMNAEADSAGLPVPKAPKEPYRQSHDFFDVSRYEGVAFWARRGPEGHDRALVILTDKFTSSRLARENQKYCRRVRECHSACLSGVPCSPSDPNMSGSIHRCFDAKAGDLPRVENESLLELMYPRCGPSACTSPSSYLDPDFDDKACRPYAFPAADESGEYCWNADDPPPPSRDERCQDGWQVSIELTPDWKFYALPFSQFGQVGFGKRAPFMDLKSLDTIAFGATMGWSDMYFDNVTFYRRKK